MSYDVTVNCHTCGNTLNRMDNMTSNISGVWDKAGATLRDWNGKIGVDVLPALSKAIYTLQNLDSWDRKEYEKLVRGGGTWGTIDDALPFLESIRDGICLDPWAKLWVGY